MTPADPDADLLRRRARALARPAGTPRDANALELLQFRLAGEHYGIESRWVAEVVPLRELAVLPGAPPFMRGIVPVRGRILPVFDLKRLFQLPEEGISDLHCVLVVRSGDLEFGLLADAVTGVAGLEIAALQPVPATFTDERASCVRGVAAGPLIVLDADRLCALPQLIVDTSANALSPNSD